MITQGLLFNNQCYTEKKVDRDMVKANFVKTGDTQYQITLEVSTNKFLLNVWTLENEIESFEVVAIKGFIELTTKVLSLLKRLVVHLWNMID